MIKTIVPAIFLFLLIITGCGPDHLVNNTITVEESFPQVFQEFIGQIQYDTLGTYEPEISIETLSDELVRVNLTYHLDAAVRQDDWQVYITPKFQPAFHWAPHLTPTDTNIISQHVFRAPALIVADQQKQVVVIPDLDLLKNNSPVKWYMDLDAEDNVLTLGASEYGRAHHVLFTKDTGMVIPQGDFQFGFYLMAQQDSASLFNPWRKPLAFFWERWGQPLYESGEPIQGSLEPYVQHTYNWAFNSWKDHVWQEFTLRGNKVGAPTFIVNVTQSPNYPGAYNEREFKSVWNQAWFSSLRSAQGLYRYGRRTNNPDYIQKANLGKELALSIPQKEGFFYGLIATEMEKVEIDGEEYDRSKGWNYHYFGNSNRNPYSWDARESPFHILDMSWTAYLMLTWYEELEKDERLLAYTTRYADALLTLQDAEGFFPAWLSTDTLEPLEVLSQSPETSMSVTFLLKLYEITGNEKYRSAAIKAMDAVLQEIVPEGRWEDFETYWSCSRYGSEDLVGKKISRNDMYKQNNFSMYWTAEALLHTYRTTQDEKYIRWGQRTLDELLMTQATWQPSYMYVHTLGGFGVMNADAEWNDSRQCLFAELIVNYGKELEREEYIQRGLAALRASFVMMYCPENPETKVQWEKKYDFFNEKDYGFMMENYGHDGFTNPEGMGIGVFTIYDWGNGAASEAYNRMADHLGEAFINGK